MSEWKKTCGNCAGRVESIIYKDRCDITEEVIEDMSATCDDWEPNNEVLREMQDDELKALRKKCDKLERQLQAAALSMNYSAVCPWHELSMGCEQEPNCNKNTSVAVDCWREYWRRQSEEAQL